jgi:hypothetical protein
MTYGLAYAFSVPKASKNPSGAYAIASVLSGANASVSAATALSMAPAVRSGLSVTPNDKYAAIFYPEALIARGWLSPAPRTVDQVFGTMITNITSGRAATAQAIQTASQALDAAL